jgi:GNAT superfamily N-acetyltransferase
MGPEPQGLNLRHATLQDLDAIAANNIATAWETEQRIIDPGIARKGVTVVLTDPTKGFYLLAVERGIIAGQCMVTYEWSDWRNGTFWWIQSVYVRKAWRERGIFSLLFHALEKEAKNRTDVVGIRLYVDQENTTARAAYRARGMKEARYILYEIDFTLD